MQILKTEYKKKKTKQYKTAKPHVSFGDKFSLCASKTVKEQKCQRVSTQWESRFQILFN